MKMYELSDIEFKKNHKTHVIDMFNELKTAQIGN